MPTEDEPPSPMTERQRAVTKAFAATARRIVKRAQAEPDPPTASHLFRSQSFESAVLQAMGPAWAEDAAAIRGLDPAWREARATLRACVRTLEQRYQTWFESGGGYDEEHIPPAPDLDQAPRSLAWTNPTTGQVAQGLQIGQVVVLSSRWVKYRVPRPRWEKRASWYETSRGFLLHTTTLSALLPDEKEQQEARATSFAETLSALCSWEAYFTAPHTVQRSIRKRFLAQREIFEQS